MADKIKTVAVFFGGASAEHEVSIVSARAVLENLDSSRFSPLAVFVDRDGIWRRADAGDFIRSGVPPQKGSGVLVPAPGCGGTLYEIKNGSVAAARTVDAAFPVIHGTDGEDGAMQGLFEIWKIPYVGTRVLGSAVSADKLAAKHLLKNADLPVVPFYGAGKNEWKENGREVLSAALDEVGLPCFVKSSNLGSSICVFKTENAEDASRAAEKSFEFSDTVIFERAVPNPREIEVSILGLDKPKVSVPGEIIPAGDFYDYKSKYGGTGSRLIIPASLPADIENKIRADALKTFSVLRCAAMARVDFLLNRATGDFFVSELNTIPGFTSISMYPKLWEASGVSFSALINGLVDLAFESARKKKTLKINYEQE